MYCGDETGSFLGEVGSHTSRFGYGGDDAPKYVVPSWLCSERVDESCPDPDSNETKKTTNRGPIHRVSSTYRYRSDRTYRSPVKQVETPNQHPLDLPILDPNRYLQQGESINDWDAFTALWESALDTMCVRDNTKHTAHLKRPRVQQTMQQHASGASSTSVMASSSSAAASSSQTDNSIIHPILVIRNGWTHHAQDWQCGTSGNAENIGIAAGASRNRKELSQLTELFMETIGATTFFIAPAPMLSAFSLGRQTSLVVDVGAGGCRVTPVVQGLILRQAQRRNGRGGDWLGNVGWKALTMDNDSENAAQLRPRYQCTASSMPSGILSCAKSSIYHRWAMQDLMYEIRSSSHTTLQSWCYDASVPFLYSVDDASSSSNHQVCPAPSALVSSSSTSSFSSLSYELPDGTLIDLKSRVGKDLCRIPELLFTDEIPYVENKINNIDPSPFNSNLSLPRLIHASLSAVGDVDARRELANSIILTGGSSVIPNLEQRLSIEVPRLISSAFKTKVVASKHSIERSCASWIGGSILTSLGSFQQLWLSKSEYYEYGSTLATQRFPL